MSNLRPKLTEEQEELAFELVLQRRSFAQVAKALGFPSDMAFYNYRKKYPDFDRTMHAAREACCDYIEDDMMEVTSTFEDAKMARVQMEVLGRVLAYRNPQKYGTKIDMTITQTLDLSSVLTAASARLPSNTRDVLPAPPTLDEIL